MDSDAFSFGGGIMVTHVIEGENHYLDPNVDLKVDLSATNIYVEGTGIIRVGSASFVDSNGDLKITTASSRTVVLEEPVYDDLPPTPITSARLGSTAPTLASFMGNIEQYTFDTSNDYVVGATELTHSYREGSPIEIHVHWVTNGTNATVTNVRWQLEYSYANDDSNFLTVSSAHNIKIVSAATSDRTHIVTTLGTMNDANFKIGTYIAWRLNRLSVTGSDTALDPFCLAVGFHVQQDTVGSRQRYLK